MTLGLGRCWSCIRFRLGLEQLLMSDEALYRTLDYTISYLASGNRILFAEVPAV